MKNRVPSSMKSRKNIIFLYTEIAQYLVACISELKDMDIHIFRYPVNKEAPFEFAESNNIFYHDRHSLDFDSLKSKIQEINPDMIVCSGWIDRDYLKICKMYHGKISTVLMFDNYWENTLRQHLATVLSPFYLKKRFSKVWVPGEIHRKYAKKLGYADEQIQTGFYVADIEKFNNEFDKVHDNKKEEFPKVFIYVGRYLALKGVEDLWEAFNQFSNLPEGKDWSLWCVGAGDLYESRPKNDKIKHFGFIQPSQLMELVKDAGVFMMPSHYDHWGVAVQEFAAAGCPLICSDKVGAISSFLEEGKNGFIHEIKSPETIVKAMLKISKKGSEELWEMGKISHQKAQSITKQGWTKALETLL
ncbi:MAG: glycosyltransferase involved in cell wall biosynthesis [Bacteroidia bacterium]|jgi:glycosyltransferase involved in cell wall biosynthesis